MFAVRWVLLTPSFQVRFNETAYNNEDLIAEWLLGDVKAYSHGRPTLLVWDAFRAHKTPKIREILRTLDNVTVALIPGGLTGLLQPLDTHCNKILKNLLQDEADDYEAKFEKRETFSGKWTVSDKRVMTTHITAQALHQFYATRKDMIKKSFIDTGIAIAPDGSEDHLINIKMMQPHQIDFTGWQEASNKEAYHTEELIEDPLLRELYDFYEERTVRELKELCKLRALTGYSKLKKAELVDKLSKADDRYLLSKDIDNEEVVDIADLENDTPDASLSELQDVGENVLA